MTRRAIATLAILALLAIGGCTKSDDGDGAQANGTPPGTKWADAFCTAYHDWATSITAKLASVQLVDPAQGPAAAHTVLTQVAARARDETATVVGAIDAAGDPPIADGTVIAVDVLRAFQQAETAFSDALSGLQSVNPNDPAILLPGSTGVRIALVDALAVARNELAAALSEPNADELTAAFAAAPACDDLFAPPAQE